MGRPDPLRRATTARLVFINLRENVEVFTRLVFINLRENVEVFTMLA